MEKTLQILSNATGTNTELLNIKVSPGVGDIVVQLDIFDEQKRLQRLDSASSLNLNSHLDIFHAILRQIENTPHKLQFLDILQHLLRIDPKESVSDVVWVTAEKLVHRAIQLENVKEAEYLLRTAISHKFTCQNCSTDSTRIESDDSDVPTQPPPPPTPDPTVLPSLPPPPPPPPPPPAPGGPPPPPPAPSGPPPPPPPPAIGGPPPPPPPSLIPGAPVPPPIAGIPLPPPLMPGGPAVPGAPPTSNTLLPQQNTPKASTKMKTLNWTKIPPHKIMGKQNLWTIMANNRQYNCLEMMDFKQIEGLFCLQAPKSEALNEVSDADVGKKKKSKQINLLESTRSLKINIFLSQFKGYDCNEDIIQLIRGGQHKVMGPEKLKDLLKNLPEKEEIEVLLTFDGDYQHLGNAEKFLLLLLAVPNYKLRIECMLLKEEFAVNVTYLEPCISSLFKAGDDIKQNKALQEVLCLIMIIGNFLNSGGYAGNAVGIKLTSLTKLTDIRANKSGMNLMHFIANEVERYNPELLNFTNELSFLENVSKINVDQITKDINDLDLPLQKIKQQIELPNCDEDIREQMGDFLKSAENQIGHLKNGMNELESLRLALADFFCEDPPTFKLDECFRIFHIFCDKFKISVKENERRVHLEKRAIMRQKQKEEQLARKTKYAGSSSDAGYSPVLSLKRSRIACKRTDDINKTFISTENATAIGEGLANLRSHNIEEEDELLKYLRSSELADKTRRGRPRSRKTSLDKCPDLLKFINTDERERCPNVPPEHKENSLANKADEIKQEVQCTLGRPMNLLHRRLSIQNGTGNECLLETLPEDKCLAVSTPKRESLQILVHSNSIVDDNSILSKRSSAIIEVIKTPLAQSKPVFTFPTIESSKSVTKSSDNLMYNNGYGNEEISSASVTNDESEISNEPRSTLINIKHCNSVAPVVETKENNSSNVMPAQFKRNSIEKTAMGLKIPTDCENEIPTSPTTEASAVMLRQRNLSFKTVANLAKLGYRRYSTINEQDLQKARKNLRTPTVDGREFSFSPVRELPPKSSLATPTRSNVNNLNSTPISNQRTPTVGGSEYSWGSVRQLLPTSSLATPTKTKVNQLNSNFQMSNQKLTDKACGEEQKVNNENTKTQLQKKPNELSNITVNGNSTNTTYIGQNGQENVLKDEQNKIPGLQSPPSKYDDSSMLCDASITKNSNANTILDKINIEPNFDTPARETLSEDVSTTNEGKFYGTSMPTIGKGSSMNSIQNQIFNDETPKPMKPIEEIMSEDNNITNDNNSLFTAPTTLINSPCQLSKDLDFEEQSTAKNPYLELNQRTNLSNGEKSTKPPTAVNEVSPSETLSDAKTDTNSDSSKTNNTAKITEITASKPTLSRRLVNKLQIPINTIRALSPLRSQHSTEAKTKEPHCNNTSNTGQKKSKMLQFAQRFRLAKKSSLSQTPQSSIATATIKDTATTSSSADHHKKSIRNDQIAQESFITTKPPTIPCSGNNQTIRFTNSKLSSRTTSLKEQQPKAILNGQFTQKSANSTQATEQKSNPTHKNTAILKSKNNMDLKSSAIKLGTALTNSVTNMDRRSSINSTASKNSIQSNSLKKSSSALSHNNIERRNSGNSLRSSINNDAATLKGNSKTKQAIALTNSVTNMQRRTSSLSKNSKQSVTERSTSSCNSLRLSRSSINNAASIQKNTANSINKTRNKTPQEKVSANNSNMERKNSINSAPCTNTESNSAVNCNERSNLRSARQPTPNLANAIDSTIKRTILHNNTASINRSTRYIAERKSSIRSSDKSGNSTNPAQHNTSIHNSLTSMSSKSSKNSVQRRGSTTKSSVSNISSRNPVEGRNSISISSFINNPPSTNAQAKPAVNRNNVKRGNLRNSLRFSQQPSSSSANATDSTIKRNILHPSINAASINSATRNTTDPRSSIPSSLTSMSSITSANSVQRRGCITKHSINSMNSINKSPIQRKSSTHNFRPTMSNISSASQVQRRDNISKSSTTSAASNVSLAIPSANINEIRVGVGDVASLENGSRNIKILRKMTAAPQPLRTDVKIKATIMNPYTKNVKLS